MDIVITTSEPDQIDSDEIREVLERLDYHVNSLRILNREGQIVVAVGRPL